MAGMTHSHDGTHSHSHAHDAFSPAEHGHSHEILDGPGSYLGREMPLTEGRNWADRAFTVGIGGYVSRQVPGPNSLPPLSSSPVPSRTPLSFSCPG